MKMSKNVFVGVPCLVLLAILESNFAVAKPAPHIWYLIMTGGGWTGAPIAMKSKAACEKTRSGLLNLDKHRHSMPLDKTVAYGKCVADIQL